MNTVNRDIKAPKTHLRGAFVLSLLWVMRPTELSHLRAEQTPGDPNVALFLCGVNWHVVLLQ